MSKKLVTEILTSKNIRHEFIPLPEDLSLDVASHVKFHKISTKDAMPTMIFKTEKGLIAAQKRADTKIDNKKLKKLADVQSLRIANEEELSSVGLQSGMVPPLGFDMPFFLDKRVLENEVVYTGSGERLFALKINPHDLQKANQATVADFSELSAAANKRVLSGIRATGRLHLGNYLGAVKGMLALQDNPEYETFYMVADVHTITTPYSVDELRKNRREVIIDYLAAGLDPKKSVIFLQSMVPAHLELAFYFSSVMTIARMQHLPTFKEKVKQYPEAATMALLNYPILMSADILVYKAGLVPVGIDQEPHLEIAREIARKMNETYGTDFPEPQRFKDRSLPAGRQGEYVPSLAGEGKMSKSVEGSYINLTDDLETIKKRLAAAPTDSGTTGGDIPKDLPAGRQGAGVANLFALFKLFDKDGMYEKFVGDYREKRIRYAEMKETLSNLIYEELRPIQSKRRELEDNPSFVDQVIKEGAQKARAAAQETIKEVKEKMGLV